MKSLVLALLTAVALLAFVIFSPTGPLQCGDYIAVGLAPLQIKD